MNASSFTVTTPPRRVRGGILWRRGLLIRPSVRQQSCVPKGRSLLRSGCQYRRDGRSGEGNEVQGEGSLLHSSSSVPCFRFQQRPHCIEGSTSPQAAGLCNQHYRCAGGLDIYSERYNPHLFVLVSGKQGAKSISTLFACGSKLATAVSA